MDILYIYIIDSWSDKAFTGTVVNPSLPSLHGGSLEITLRVPLSEDNWMSATCNRGCVVVILYFISRVNHGTS